MGISMKVWTKRLTTVLIGAALCTAAFSIHAAELKIGFVNAGRVLEEAPQAEDARLRIEKEFAPRDKALVKVQQAIRKSEEKLARDGAIMSESERRKLERDIISQKRDLKRSKEEFREDLNIRGNEMREKLSRRVLVVITDISKKEKYDLVVSDGVVFANERVDMTGKVIDRLKQEFKQSSKK